MRVRQNTFDLAFARTTTEDTAGVKSIKRPVDLIGVAGFGIEKTVNAARHMRAQRISGDGTDKRDDRKRADPAP